MNFIPSAERTTFGRFQLTNPATIIAYGIGRGLLLPEWCYFEMKADLVVAQTIQLVTYGAAAVGSAAYLSIVWFGRRRVPC